MDSRRFREICENDVLMLEDFHENPALQFAERAAFLHLHAIAHLGFTLFIMGIELGRLLDDFAEFGVGDPADYGDHDGLVHAGGSDNSDTLFAATALVGGFGGWVSGLFAHRIKRVGQGLVGGSRVTMIGENGFNAGNGTAQVLDAGGVLHLAAFLLQAEVHDLVLHVGATGDEFSRGGVKEFLDFHGIK